MTLYLKSRKTFSATQVNAIPTSIGCAEILFTFIASVAADWTQLPALVILAFGALQVYGYAVLTAWPAKHEAWLISTYIVGASGYSAIGPIINAWANRSCGGDKHLRVFTTALITAVG